MKVQKIIPVIIFSFAFGSSLLASNDPVKKEVKPTEKEIRKEHVAAPAMDEFEKSVELWVEPVPNAVLCKEKEGILA